jgi:catalase
VGGASREVQQRHIANCSKADPAYGAGVAAALERGVSSKTPNPVV